MSREWRELRVSISSHVAPLGHPAGVDPQHFHLIAPFTKDARQWSKVRWTDVYSGGAFGITTRASVADSRTARVQSYGDVIARYRAHPEAKRLGRDGTPCGRQTVGLLQRRPVTLGEVVYVGKETNRLEAVEAGTIHDLDEVQLVVRAPQEEPAPQNAKQPANTCCVCRAPIGESRANYCSPACKQHAYRRRLRASLG